MKVAVGFVSLAILAGALAVPFAWDHNTLYTYRVQSRFAAGMLGLDGPTVDDTETDRALVELTWKVDVYQRRQNQVYLNPKGFQAVIAKAQINPRDEPISSQKEVAIPLKYQQLLEKVIIVNLDPKSGVPESIVVRADEPLTASEKNMKREQVQSFIMNPGTSKLILKGNVNRQTNSVRPSEQDNESGFFYKVMEESIHGECQTYYQVSQTGHHQSLYQLEAQDVPVPANEQGSQEQPINPRFANYQKQQEQWQQWQYPQVNENEVNQDSQQQLLQQQLPWPRAYQQFCSHYDQVYHIQKTVNLTACKDRPVLTTTLPSELVDCRPGDNTCGSLWSHVVNTHFIACGESRRDFTILEVNQEERFVYGLRDEQNIDGYAVKNVTLQRKERTNKNPAEKQMEKQGKNEYTIRSLVFEFDVNEQQKQLGQEHQNYQWQQKTPKGNHHQHQQDSDSHSQEDYPQASNGQSIKFPLQNQKPSLENPPLRPQLITAVTSPQQLQERALELLYEAANNIVNYKMSIPEGETIALQSILAKILRYMTKQQQLNLYQQALQNNKHDEELQGTVQNILVDAMAASGTNPSLVALMDLIESEQITGSQANQLVMTFSHYVRHPTKQWLERFYQFTQHKTVQNEIALRGTAILALSHILNKACVNAQSKQSSFSYALYGPFCQLADTELFVEQATNHLEKALKKSDKSKAHEVTLHLAALGNVGHPKIVNIVQKILDESNNIGEKTKAIYALKNLIRSQADSNPVQDNHGNVDTEQNQNEVDRVESDPITDQVSERKVLPILASTAFDKTEAPPVNIAALQMLMYSTYADVTIWQQIAMYTWVTPSQEVHHFIYTTLQSLAALEYAPSQVQATMVVNARAALPLAKPLDTESYARASNSFASGKAPHLNSEFFRQFTWIGSRDSAWPTSAYFRNTIAYGSGAVEVNPIEVAVHFRTIQQVVNKIAANFGSSSSEESGEKNQYMQQILKNVLPREMKEQLSGSVYVNFRNGMQRLWQMESMEEYLSYKNVAKLWGLFHGVPFNYQKTIQLASQTIVSPTILGLPISFKLRVPAMISLRGKAKFTDVRGVDHFQAEIDAVAGYKRHAKIALKIPYLQRKLESGLQSHFVAQTPFRFTVSKQSDQPIVVAITPTANINGTASGQIELATFHRQPYVAIITDELYPSVHIKGGQMTVLRTLDAPTTNENYYNNVLGFSVSTKEESDYRPEEETQEGWLNHLNEFEDVETFAHLGYAGGPQAKYASRKVILNVDESKAKTLVVLVAAKRGSGSLEQGLDTDVSSSSSSSSSTSESDSSDSSDSSSEEEQRQNGQARQNSQQGQQQDSSSSSSSSESNEASNSNENSAEVFQKGALFVVAVVAKKQEIPPVSSRSVPAFNLLQAAYPNQQQFIFQISKRTDKFFVRFAQGVAAEEAARSLPTSSNSLTRLATAMIAPDYQGQQAEFCAEVAAKMQYPKHAHPRLLVALREALLNNDLNVQLQARAQFAHTCKDEDLQQNQIFVNGQLQREANMTEWARAKSPEAQQCQEDEAQGFSVSDDCLTVAVEQASALNQARFSVQWSEGLPEALQQAVYAAVDAAKATYQAHAYHDRFPENPANGNQAIVTLQITPDGEFWSANVLTNETELQLQNVPSNAAIQAAFPPSAIQSVYQNIEDTLYGEDSQPTCQLEGKTISSFDSVVGQIDTNVAQGCYHLLVADGSGEDTMAVLAKNVGTDNVKLQVILSKTKIQLSSQRSIPRARVSQVEKANDIIATVNGQSVALPYTVRQQGQRAESNDYVARIQAHPSGGVQVLTPKNDIAFDGSKIIIFADESYRNKTIGMCGDFDGEKVADRRSLQDIPLSDATLLYANYAYDVESSQCNVNQQTKQQIRQEESLAKTRGHFQQTSNSQKLKAWQNHQQTGWQQQQTSWQQQQQQTAWQQQQQQTAWQQQGRQQQQDSSEETQQRPQYSRH